jgi:uncharacterized pyridoxal phosphate-containing UPF0001 family protein
MDILVQVNAAQEESKFGITTEETGKLIEESEKLPEYQKQRLNVPLRV